MSIPKRLAFVLLSSLVSAAVPAQQNTARAQPDPNRIYLDVVVTPKSGAPVADLQKSDFTVLDNKVPQPLTTFDALGGSQAPVEVILLIDAVNANFHDVSYQRIQIDKFLRANGGHLAQPLSLAIFTDTGTQIQEGPSSDGNAISASLDKTDSGLREINRSTGFWGADERLNLSLNALQTLAAKEAARPGRKIILWVSPGWPYLSSPHVDLDAKQQQQLLSEIEQISTTLRRGGITLYSVDPIGAEEGVGRMDYYQEFLKPVTKPGQVQLGNLSLQVLAIQSGGLALSGSNDVSGLLQRCMNDSKAYYELSFEAPPAEHRDEYHQVEIKIAKPGLIARTRTGYYAQP
jgi:VWFA-related protein